MSNTAKLFRVLGKLTLKDIHVVTQALTFDFKVLFAAWHHEAVMFMTAEQRLRGDELELAVDDSRKSIVFSGKTQPKET